MSTAEITAHRIYNSYHLGELPEDVKKHLMILFLSENKKKTDDVTFEGMAAEEFPPRVTTEELRARISCAEAEILAGKTNPVEDFEGNMEAKYPWLCE
jgi:hypothetical protein